METGDLARHSQHGLGIVLKVEGAHLEVFLGDGLRLVCDNEGWETLPFSAGTSILANFCEMVIPYLQMHGAPMEQIEQALSELQQTCRTDGALDLRSALED